MHEILWAPWRLEYIGRANAGKTTDIFLDLPAENEDEKNLILFRGETSFVILNRFPYANGHLLIAPYRQVADLSGLDNAELLEINQLLARCEKVLRTVLNPHGFNVGVNIGRGAGAGIPIHIHWHIVPRWEGDSNFMAVTGGTRVIPQTLEDTYRLLHEVILADPK